MSFSIAQPFSLPDDPENTTVYPFSIQGIRSLADAIVQCFELHHQLTGCKQYYALAIEEKRARFYTRIAESPAIKGRGFEIHCGLGSDKLAYLIERV